MLSDRRISTGISPAWSNNSESHNTFRITPAIELPYRQRSGTSVIPVDESSIVDEEPYPVTNTSNYCYEVIVMGSRKNTDLLLDGKGFSYTVKNSFPNSKTWMCSTNRNGPNPCRATVREINGNFTSKSSHTHLGHLEVRDKVKIRKDIKKRALASHFESAKNIVEDVYLEHRRENPTVSLPNEAHSIRAANRARQLTRPSNPRDRDFVLNESFVENNFYRGEVICGSGSNRRRHLIFMSDYQIILLAKAKRWYVDGTFKIVDQKLFTQLFSIHAFIKKGKDNVKQVPLAFALMTSRKSADYRAVLGKILDILPYTRVQEIVSDFEKAFWKTTREINADPNVKSFKNVKHFGCAFHFNQAVYRRIQKLGLGSTYNRNREVKEICRRLMCIHLIDHRDVSLVLEILEDKIELVKHPEKLKELLNYVRNNWLDNSLWIPQQWSGFKQPIRTNNDAEGWHLRLNRRGKDGCPAFYSLLKLLFKESELIPIQATLLCQRKLKRTQKAQYMSIQKNLFTYWGEYENRKHGNDPMTPWKLLKLVASAYSSVS